MRRVCAIGSAALLSVLLVIASGCTGNPFAPPPAPLTAEAFCATLPSIGTGNFFFCGTNQANLATTVFPDGAHGYCMSAAANNLGLVGYSAYTYSGGAAPVDTQSNASTLCHQLGNQCAGYIRCTRQ